MNHDMLHMDLPLLYRAALCGVFGQCRGFESCRIVDALFVYLDGKPDPEAIAALETQYNARPWVCLSTFWEDCIRARYPHARVFTRYMMKPARRFCFPISRPLPMGCRLATMDESAFALHPFSHGANYADYASFQSTGAGAVVWLGDEIIASASSFLSMDGEIEMDIYTRQQHRGKGIAGACVEKMLRECMMKDIIVHWDAQNEISRHLAEKYGFELDNAYTVYFRDEPSRS